MSVTFARLHLHYLSCVSRLSHGMLQPAVQYFLGCALEDPELDTRQGQPLYIFFKISGSALGPTQPHIQCETGSFPRGKAGRIWTWSFTLLMPRLGTNRVIDPPLLPLNYFVTLTGASLPLTFVECRHVPFATYAFKFDVKTDCILTDRVCVNVLCDNRILTW